MPAEKRYEFSETAGLTPGGFFSPSVFLNLNQGAPHAQQKHRFIGCLVCAQ